MISLALSRTASLLERAVAGCAVVTLACVQLDDDLVLCPFRLLAGLLCPLCGITRGVSEVFHANIGSAMRRHALSPLVAALLIAAALGFRPPNRLLVCLVYAAGAFGIVRLLLGWYR